MSAVDGMIISLIIILLVANSVVLAITFLPNNVDGTGNYAFGMNSLQITQLNASIGNIVQDANTATIGKADTTASNARITGNGVVDSILFGGIQVVTGIVDFAAGVFSLLAWILRYLPFFLWGWIWWIDYFLGALYTLAGIGGFFTMLGLGLKALFSVVYIFGFMRVVLPIFIGGSNR